MSRGGAERNRAGADAPTASTSSRVTARTRGAGPARRTNWLVVVLITLVMLGLVGGFFISLVAGTDPATTVPTTLGG